MAEIKCLRLVHFIWLYSGRYRLALTEEYKTLKRFLLDAEYREIELVYGASLGVAIGYRIFLDPDFTVRHAWFDGVALSRNARFPE